MVDPDVIDLVFYSTLSVVSAESVFWWISRWREVKRPRPQIIVPELVKSAAITVALLVMAAISMLLALHADVSTRLFWAPIARRIQGVALAIALFTHWFWRTRIVDAKDDQEVR